jgi:zinc transport system substrate-binding protein
MVRTFGPRLIGALALVLLAGAGRPGSAAAIDVVVSIKPVHALVAGVMTGVGEPALLVKGAGSPHSYSLRPSQARALDAADVVFWVGAGLEAFLVKPLRALSGSAAVVTLSEASGLRPLAAREGGMWQAPPERREDTEDERRADRARDQDAEHGDGAGQGRLDLHLWLDPHNAEAMVGAIVAALSEADPDHAVTYRGNGDRLRARLQELDAALRAGLLPVRDRPFVVFHDAYQYFEHRYRLNAVGSIAVDPARRPGARRLADLRRRLAELDAACVFAEPQFEPALVDTVIEGTRARKGVLDPLGADLDPGPDQYFRLLEGLADALIGCLGATRSG